MGDDPESSRSTTSRCSLKEAETLPMFWSVARGLASSSPTRAEVSPKDTDTMPAFTGGSEMVTSPVHDVLLWLESPSYRAV